MRIDAVGAPHVEDALRNAQYNKSYQELMDEVVFAVFKAPYNERAKYLEDARKTVMQAASAGNITTGIRDGLISILEGKSAPPRR